MRVCMYCGKELEKGEMCDCAASAARRNAKSAGNAEQNKTGVNNGKEAKTDFENGYENDNNPYGGQENSGARDNTETEKKDNNAGTGKKTKSSYKTGYAGNDNRFDRARDKFRARRAAKRNSGGYQEEGFFSNLWKYIVSFIKTPVDSITNPKPLGKGSMLIIAALQGALLWLCIFFISRGGAVGPFRLLASAMSFAGREGYRLIVSICIYIISGAIGGIVLFFLYSGIFFLINKFIMRVKTGYWEFCVRLIAAWIPFTLICLIGAVISIFSPITLAALIFCGAMTMIVLTYEALKTEWIAYSPSKVISAMALGYFIFFTIVAHLIVLD